MNSSKKLRMRLSQPMLPVLQNPKPNKSLSSMNKTNKPHPSKTESQKSDFLLNDLKSSQGLASLEKKVDKLLKLRIRMLMVKDKSEEFKEMIRRIDIQLDNVRRKVLKFNKENAKAEHVQNGKTTVNMSAGHPNCHNFLDNKIRLIERLISHNVTDAEILKGFYQIFTHTTQYDKLGGKINKIASAFDTQTNKFQRDRQSRVYPHQTITLQTTNQSDYLRPKGQFYSKLRTCDEHDEQNIDSSKFESSPVPRSTYQQQYPGYIATQVYKHIPVDESVKTVSGFYGGAVTSYMKGFNNRGQQMKQSKPNYYKDNIKNLDIVYRTDTVKVENRAMALLEREWCQKPIEKAVMIKAYKGQFSSIAGNTFARYDKNVSYSSPKNSRLGELIDENRSLLYRI